MARGIRQTRFPIRGRRRVRKLGPPWLFRVLVVALQMAGAIAEASESEAGRTLKTIVLDPGHGGEDLGVIGRSGLSERDVAADVCRRVARIFEERLGTQRIVLTHARETSMDMAARASLANGRKGDVLLSVHAAGSMREAASGPRVYVMGNAPRVVELTERRLRPRARRLLQQSEAPIDDSDLRLTPWAMAQQEFTARSAALAMTLSRTLAAVAGKAPVSELPIPVVSGARMPSVLVEVGHLTNSSDEDRLRSDRYREAIAHALFEGIVGFGMPRRADGGDASGEPGAE